MNRKIAFTLVEMLIVVVIIGILASALLPRLTGAQARARDAARKGHLNQITTALGLYFNDEGRYPDGNCVNDGSGSIASGLVNGGYINSIPTDPQGQRVTYGTRNNGCLNGSYGYLNLSRNNASNAGMVVVANTETEGNYVLTGTKTNFIISGDAVDLENFICKKVKVNKTANNSGCNVSNNILEGTVRDVDNMVYVIFQ